MLLPFTRLRSNVLSQASRLLSQATGYLFPFVSRIHELGQLDELEKHYREINAILVSLSMAMVTPIFVCGLPIISLWLGEDEAKLVVPLVQILAIRFALLPLGGVLIMPSLRRPEKRELLLIVQLITCTVVISSTFIGAKYWGLSGAAWAQLSVLLTVVGNRAFIEKTLFLFG